MDVLVVAIQVGRSVKFFAAVIWILAAEDVLFIVTFAISAK
jgi:hypothetical protein